MSQRHKIWILFNLLALAVWAEAQNNVSQPHPSLFNSDDVLKICITFDITQHIRTKSENYSTGKIIFYETDQDSSSFKVRYKARGNFRKEHCIFPPLMLNFKPDTLFTDDGYITKIKHVSHCIKSKLYKRIVLEEYLIYKLWEIISPYAMRTRLLDITYRDTGPKKRNSRHFGFFIEPMYMMTQRTKTIEVKGEYFKDDEINQLDADRVAIFNYMIGNTDWRIKSGHNIKFIKRFGHRREEVTAIPYDFDHSGLINAPYAEPAEWSTAESVMERDYCGHCRLVDDNYHHLIDDFMAVEAEIIHTIMAFEHLDLKTRKRIHKYIATFYKELKNRKNFIRTLNNNCMERY